MEGINRTLPFPFSAAFSAFGQFLPAGSKPSLPPSLLLAPRLLSPERFGLRLLSLAV